MTYRSGRSKAAQKYINLALGLVAFSMFVYFWSEFRSTVYPTFEAFVRGYGGTKQGIKIMPSFVTSYFSSRTGLVQEKRDLELTVERLENILAEREAFIREQILIHGSGTPEGSSPVIVMYPIASDITKLYSTLLLSKGFRDGVEKGGIVYVRGLQPVCEVVEVYNETSLCELLSKGGRETEVVTASGSLQLILQGAGGGSFVAETPKGTAVLVGEQVYLRSDPSFVVGTVIAIQDDKQATGAKLFIRGAYNPITSSVFYIRVRHAP